VQLCATTLAELCFARVFSWPDRIDPGNGPRLLVIDEQASPLRREVLAGRLGGKQGGGYLEIFAAIELGGRPR
jgi:hypothetical protein